MVSTPPKFTATILGSGTSTGVPMPGCLCAVCSSRDPLNTRLRASAVLQFEDHTTVLIDASPDLRQQALKYHLTRVDSILFTHAHSDHILGLDDLRAFNFTSGKSIPCFGLAETFADIKRIFWYIFEHQPKYQGGMVSQLTLHELIGNQSFLAAKREFIPIPIKHGNMDVLGYRYKGFAYITDCNFIPQESLALLQDLKVLVLDGLRYEPHKTHFSIPEALGIIEQLKPEQAFLTHLSHNVDYHDTCSRLPAGVGLACDGLRFELEDD